MGAGIAQLAARSGARTLLHDPLAEALERGVRRARDGLAKEAAKGRLSSEEAERPRARACSRSDDLAALARLRARDRGRARAPRAQARAVSRACRRSSARECVLATNTSSLLVTAIAAARQPPRARRGHALLQPRAGHAPAGGRRRRAVLRASALALAHATGEAMGKTVIRAARRPGLPGQPLQPPVRPGGAAPAAGADRRRRDDRPDRAAWRAAFAWARSS